MSTPGNVRRPSTSKTSGKATAADGAKPKTGASGGSGARAGGKPAGKSPAGRGPAGRGGGKGRKPITPVRVAQGRNWGPIAMFTAAAVLAVGIIGFGAWQVYKATNKPSWQEQVKGIDGIVNYLTTRPDMFKVPANGNHRNGVLTYEVSPPVGGVHNPVWQNCMGNVYAAEIPKEQAVHSLEHGAVWITYRPDLPKGQIEELADKVNGRGFMLMSPYPGLDKPISLQAWGYQLKVDSAGDGRIDEFITALRQNATQEPGAVCSRGITDTGTKPLDLEKVSG
jgi:hypothetical protein